MKRLVAGQGIQDAFDYDKFCQQAKWLAEEVHGWEFRATGGEMIPGCVIEFRVTGSGVNVLIS